MSAPTAKIVTTKEMENKMEKTFSELQQELEALVLEANPNKEHLLHSIMYGMFLAHITKDQLQKMIDLRK